MDTLILYVTLPVAALTMAAVLRKAGVRVNVGWILGLGLFGGVFDYLIPLAMPLTLVSSGLVVVMVLVDWPSKSRDLIEALLRNRQVLLLGAFVALLMASLYWTPNYEYGLQKFGLFVARAVVVGIAVVIVCSGQCRISWRGPIVLGLVYCVALLSMGEFSVNRRLSLPDGNSIWAARSAFLLVTIAVWHPGIKKSIRILLILVGLIAGLAANSRGPLVACIVANAAVLWVMQFRKNHNQTGKVLIFWGLTVLGMVTMSLGLVALLATDPFGATEGGVRLLSLLSPSALENDINVLTRIDLYTRAIDHWVSSPLLGVGLGGYAPDGIRLYPHNLFLELMSELGVVGFVVLALILIDGFSAARGDLLILSLLLQVVVYSMFSGDLSYNYEVVLMSLVASAYSWRRGDVRNKLGSVVMKRNVVIYTT